ncbi:unnamed protein product [Lepidochelys kempii]
MSSMDPLPPALPPTQKPTRSSSHGPPPGRGPAWPPSRPGLPSPEAAPLPAPCLDAPPGRAQRPGNVRKIVGRFEHRAGGGRAPSPPLENGAWPPPGTELGESVPGRRGGAPHPGAPGRLPPTLPLRLPSAPAWHGAGLGAGPRGGGARLGRLRLHRRGGPPLPAPPGGHPRPPVPLVPPQAPCPAPRGRQRGSHQLPPTAQLTGGPALAKPPRWAKGGAPEAARPPPAVPPKTPAKPLRGTQGTGLGSWQPERGDSCPPSAAPCQAPPVPAKPCPPPRLPSPPTNPQSLPKRAPQPRPLPSLPRPPSPCQTCSLPPPPTQPPPPPAKLCPPPPAPPQKEHAPAPGDEPRQGDSDGHSPEPEPPRDRCCPSPKGPGWGLPLQDEPLYQTYRQAVIRKEIQRQTLPHSASPSSWDEAPAPPPGPPGAPRSTLWQDLPAVRESGLLWHISPQERKMQESLFEVLTSEASYQRSLRLLAQHFVGSRELGETLGPRERQALFSSVLRVKEISARFLAALQGRVAESLQIRDVSDVVAAHARRDFPAYVDYVRNQPYQEKEYSALMERNGPFGAALGRLQEHPLCQGLPLLSFLLLPFQRITRLKMLLENRLLPERRLPQSPAWLHGEQLQSITQGLRDNRWQRWDVLHPVDGTSCTQLIMQLEEDDCSKEQIPDPKWGYSRIWEQLEREPGIPKTPVPDQTRVFTIGFPIGGSRRTGLELSPREQEDRERQREPEKELQKQQQHELAVGERRGLGDPLGAEFFEGVNKHVDKGDPADIVDLNFQKAFDRIPHQRLLSKSGQGNSVSKQPHCFTGASGLLGGHPLSLGGVPEQEQNRESASGARPRAAEGEQRVGLGRMSTILEGGPGKPFVCMKCRLLELMEEKIRGLEMQVESLVEFRKGFEQMMEQRHEVSEGKSSALQMEAGLRNSEARKVVTGSK